MFCYIYVFLFIKGHCLPSVHWWGVGVNKSGDGDHRASVCLCRPVYHSERVVKQHCLKKEIVLEFFFFFLKVTTHPPHAFLGVWTPSLLRVYQRVHELHCSCLVFMWLQSVCFVWGPLSTSFQIRIHFMKM